MNTPDAPSTSRLEPLEPRLFLSATLVKDLNTTNAFDVIYQHLVEAGGKTFFVATDSRHGSELWRLDDDNEMHLVADLLPGPDPSSPTELLALHDTLYFFAKVPGAGPVLMRSDGTSAGTVVVKDVSRTADDRVVFDAHVVGDRLLFTARNTRNGKTSAYVSDGTTEGTRLVSRGSAETWKPEISARLGDRILVADRGSVAIIDADGLERTQSFRVPDALHITDIASLGDHAYIATRQDASHTAIVRMNEDFDFGVLKVFEARTPGRGDIDRLTPFAGKLLFTHLNSEPGSHELWTTDGTKAGTVRISDAAPSGQDNPSFVPWNDHLYFRDSHGGFWRTDGTAAGTTRIDTQTPLSADITAIVATDDALYLTAGSPLSVWRSDGTPNGTRLVAQAGVAPGHPLVARPDGSIAFITGFPDTHLWVSDGTAAGTNRLEGPHGGTQHSSPLFSTRIGDTIYIATADNAVWRIADDGRDATLVHTFQRPITDLFSVGDRLVVQVRSSGKRSTGPRHAIYGLDPASGQANVLHGANQSNFHLANGFLYFTSYYFHTTTALWRTDGTPENTEQVVDLGFVSDIRVTDTKIFFGATDEERGVALWVSDRTAEGTVPVKDISSGPFSTLHQFVDSTGDTVFFSVDNGADPGKALWSSDGTAQGTVPLSPKAPPGTHYLTGLAALGKFFFPFTENGRNPEPWVTDGTAKGTRKLKEINKGNFGSSPRAFTEMDGVVYFFTTGVGAVPELWRTDGTTEGTTRVRRFRADRDQPLTAIPVAANGRLLFILKRDGRYDLWSSDGTKQGTRAVRRDLGDHASHAELFATPDRVIFRAHTRAHGLELWQSDGTPEGTTLLADIAPGPSSSHSRILGLFNDRLLIAALDAEHGVEPWLIPLDD